MPMHAAARRKNKKAPFDMTYSSARQGRRAQGQDAMSTGRQY